jgi:hypothetical protein
MSYAGPISRGTRVPDAGTSRSETSATVAVRSRPSSRPLASGLGRSSTASRSTVIFAAGLAVGAVLGATGALLFAPQPGADTRRALARRGRRLGLRGRDAWQDLGDELRRFARRRRRAWQRRREHANSD